MDTCELFDRHATPAEIEARLFEFWSHLQAQFAAATKQ